MRKKALLAGALSGFEGPWVNLEAGEWLVEPSGDVLLRVSDEPTLEFGEGRFIGPSRIRAIVSSSYAGDGIFLSTQQISNGESP